MDINEIIRQVTEEICSKYGAQTQTPAAGTAIPRQTWPSTLTIPT